MIDRIKKICGCIYIGQLAVFLVLSACWWGILYPNFSMTEEIFEIVEESGGVAAERGVSREGAKEEAGQELTRTEGFFALLEAAPDEIEIKSRFWEMISGKRGKEDEQQRTDRGF